MTSRASEAQDETTPLLSYHPNTEGEGRWSLARRRSSAFLSFLSEPEDKDGDEYQDYLRKRTVYLIVFLSTIFNIGVGVYNSFAIELLQTLACAEYYYPSDSTSSPFPTLPTAGDPLDLCSVPWVDKRTSQFSTYSSTFNSVTGCVASLVLAKGLLPRYSRRTLMVASMSVSIAFMVLLAILPTHYSFDPAVASSSSTHPTTSQYLVLLLHVVGGLLGAPQTSIILLVQVTVLDVVREDEKTSGLAQSFASITIGMALSSLLLRLVLPYFAINFSILHHSGPFSPFWMSAGVCGIALLLVILYLPETKNIAQRALASRRSSVSSEDSLSDGDMPEAASVSKPRRSVLSAALHLFKDSFGLFGYLLPYKSHPEAKTDYKLPLMLIAVIFCDTITVIWSNLVVFCSTHLRFGPQEVTTLLGVLGATKGLYTLFALPQIVKTVRRVVKRRVREDLLQASVEDLTSDFRIAKREESVIYTDRLIAMASLTCDFIGFITMGIAASHLSAAGIYGSKYPHATARTR